MGELSSLRLLRCAADFFCPWDVTWSWLLNQEHPMPYPERSKKTWAAHMDCRTVKWTVVNLVSCSSTTTTEPSCFVRCFLSWAATTNDGGLNSHLLINIEYELRICCLRNDTRMSVADRAS